MGKTGLCGEGGEGFFLKKIEGMVVLCFFFFGGGLLLYCISCNRSPKTETTLDTPRRFRKCYEWIGQRSCKAIMDTRCNRKHLELTSLLKLHAPESWLAVYYESFRQKNMAPKDSQSIPGVP